MSSALSTRMGLKLRRIARELAENPVDRRWRQTWEVVNPMEGWLLESEGRWLFDAARSLSLGSVIVEIGSFKGRSTCCLASGSRQKARVFAIDTFDGGPNLPKANSLPEFQANLEHCGVSEWVEPVVALSTDVARNWNKPITLLFIDGSHNYEDVSADFAGFFPHVVPSGLVALHDVNNADWPGVKKVWMENRHLLSEVGYLGGMGFGRKHAS